MQEIYPPKLAEFAYVTDGACSETEILEQELVILKVCLFTAYRGHLQPDQKQVMAKAFCYTVINGGIFNLYECIIVDNNFVD